jgi:hypothetical protein
LYSPAIFAGQILFKMPLFLNKRNKTLFFPGVDTPGLHENPKSPDWQKKPVKGPE